MIKKEIARVSIDAAARRVGRAIFGDEWVGAITTLETWLIERYLEGLHGPSAPSIMPGQTMWIVGGSLDGIPERSVARGGSGARPRPG